MTATDDGTPPRMLTQSITLDVSANSHPWLNPLKALDTNNDLEHEVVALDALIIFNLLNNPGNFIDATGRLPAVRPADSDLPYYDPSDDGFVTSLDALLIINDLNNRPSGEGESQPQLLQANAANTSVANHSSKSRSWVDLTESTSDFEHTLSTIADDVSQTPRRKLKTVR